MTRFQKFLWILGLKGAEEGITIYPATLYIVGTINIRLRGEVFTIPRKAPTEELRHATPGSQLKTAVRIRFSELSDDTQGHQSALRE